MLLLVLNHFGLVEKRLHLLPAASAASTQTVKVLFFVLIFHKVRFDAMRAEVMSGGDVRGFGPNDEVLRVTLETTIVYLDRHGPAGVI